MLTVAFNNVFCTGTMQNASERWTSLAQTNKTWAHFQTIFAQAHEMYESLTAYARGYRGANLAQADHYNAAPSTQSDSFYTETVYAFANLTMAAISDKYLLLILTSTNTSLLWQLTAKYLVIPTL
jgi:hypothetical protein